ncbi:tetratricopeptide repeat protein [Streptomyces sp. TLI_55]|nr:tetratricopeptide repeat protein [Streptomyces sp. TLI_55]
MYPTAPAPTALASLPAAPPKLSGRDAEVEQVLSALRPQNGSPRQNMGPSGASAIAGSAAEGFVPPVLVTSVAGLAGVGKTALAVACGHSAVEAGWFSGSLFIDLHGYDESPVQPGQALEAFLRALGIDATGIPPTAEERAALYRSALEDRADQGQRLLIVADNAASADQVRLLLPGSSRHQVLITSRHTLPTINARLLDLAVLSPEAAVALLQHALQSADPTDQRARGATDGIEELAALCGYLPLALHISAALLILDPDQTFAELAADLAAALSRLSLLDDGERAVRASFDLSYRRLPPDHAELFRLLSLNPGPDIGLEAVAVLADRPVPAVRSMLRALVQAHLVASVNRRWSMHDLVREYATELAHDTGQAAAIDASRGPWEAAEPHVRACGRLLEYYATTALAASAHLTAGARSAAAGGFADQDEALAWLDRERVNLTSSVAVAAAIQHQEIAVQLPVILYDYLLWRGYFDDLIAVTTIACGVAHQAGAVAAEAGAWNNCGIALTEASRFEEAVLAHRRAADLFASVDDDNERGKALNGLGSALRESGNPADALKIYEEALAIQRACEDLKEQAAVLNNLSLNHQALENVEGACAAAEEAASLFRQLGDTTNESKALCTAAFALQASGQPKEAQAFCERAIEAASRTVASPLDEAAVLLTCTELLTDLTPQQKISYLLQAQAACERANAQDLYAHTLAALGRAWITAGDWDQGAVHLTDAATMLDDLGLADEAADIWELLALLQS